MSTEGGQVSSRAVTTDTVTILHMSFTIDTKFERFTGALETILGRFSADVAEDIEKRPQEAAARIQAMAGEQGLMIFSVLDHGGALNMVGLRRRPVST